MEETGVTRPLHLCEVCGLPATESLEGFSLCRQHLRSVQEWIVLGAPLWGLYRSIDVAVWSMRDSRRKHDVKG